MAHTPRLHFPRWEEHPAAPKAEVRTKNPTRTIKLESYLGIDRGSTLLFLLCFRIS